MKAVQVVLAAILISTASCQIESRIVNGSPVDTFRRFPHHVNIKVITNRNDEGFSNCSGSIIGNQWILTSTTCVYGGSRFRLDFNRLYLHGDAGSYSVIVDASHVIPYPTYYDDIALIHLPVTLQFSPYVNQVSLDDGGQSHNSNLVVMAGFSDQQETLTYGMFRLVSNSECKKQYGNAFDEYLQICTKSWGNNKQVPCNGNEGGGLIIGWPNKPKLIGLFSSSAKCDSQYPAIYTDVSKYAQWIQSVTGYPEVGETTTAAPPPNP